MQHTYVELDVGNLVFLFFYIKKKKTTADFVVNEAQGARPYGCERLKCLWPPRHSPQTLFRVVLKGACDGVYERGCPPPIQRLATATRSRVYHSRRRTWCKTAVTYQQNPNKTFSSTAGSSFTPPAGSVYDSAQTGNFLLRFRRTLQHPASTFAQGPVRGLSVRVCVCV